MVVHRMVFACVWIVWVIVCMYGGVGGGIYDDIDANQNNGVLIDVIAAMNLCV